MFIIIWSSRIKLTLWFLGWSGTENTFLFQELTWPSSSTYPRMMAIIINTGQGLKSIWLTKGLLPEVFLCLWFWLIISNWLPDRSNHFKVVKTKRIKSIIPIFGRNNRNYFYIRISKMFTQSFKSKIRWRPFQKWQFRRGFSTVTMYKGLFKSDNMHVIYSAELPVWAFLLRWRRRDEKIGFLWPSPLSKTMRRVTWV